MKFSTLLILLPFASLTLAAPQDTVGGVDVKCSQTYCAPMSTEILDCAKKNGLVNSDGTATTQSTTNNQAYLNCICTGTTKTNYDKCLGCFTDKTLQSQYTGAFDSACKGYTPLSSGGTNKSAASSDKTCSWRMVGFAVAGGLMAAL